MLSAAKTTFSRPSTVALGISAKNSLAKYGRNLSSATAAAADVQDVPAMPPCDFQPGKYAGPSYEDVLKIRQENMNPALFTYYKEPLLIHQGHMQWLWDHKGRRYLDMFGGIVTVSVGHCHPKINKAVQEQQSRLWHTTNIYLHPKVHEYASRLTATLPSSLNTVYFVNSGSEANDLALHMARLHTGNYDVISLRNGYHGANMSTAALTAVGTWRYPGANVGSMGVHHATCPDPYTGIWGGSNCRDSPIQADRTCSCPPNHCQAGDMYARQLKEIIDYSTPKNGGIAAFFAESIQGVGGTVQFPKGYMSKAYEMVRAKGGLCVADEVQTGFGRTGDHFWGFEGHGVVPDIVTMAKGIGNGYPIGAVVTTAAVAKSLSKALHFNTFGGNPIASTVGIAVLDAIKEDKLQENCKGVGNHFLNELAKLHDESPFVGDVRGKGLMIGVELVNSRENRTPLENEKVLKVWEAMREYGVLVGKGGLNGNVLRIKPPMCITKDDADFCVAVLRKALERV
eukprot:comp23309_c0_seq1/m.38301 comp23309_c0_seq1/g.38301  ORF comp23309_c0_seq1/g.38301 comp23309_c0_seq1/m.38301 type:complete len:512 (-) comp23309_c0_seq1:15-1550(-)